MTDTIVNGTPNSNNASVKPPAICPSKLHRTACGYTTRQGRIDWLHDHGIVDPVSVKSISESLVANTDPNAPLFHWQLHSMLGIDIVHKLVGDFYKSIYADTEEKWFRESFERISDVGHHINTQTAFWVDAFGGGQFYHGGDYRLQFHHQHNAGHVMNERGANRWMFHMNKTILNKGYVQKFNAIDHRILPCIIEFLHSKMVKYAKEFSWKFDEAPFDELKSKIADIRA